MSGPGPSPEQSVGRVPLQRGTAVEVRNRFDRSWSSGFEVAEIVEDAYRILRRSDGSVLPGAFARDDVRRERKPQGFWWH